MEQGSSKLSVFFEAPFWVGVFERWEGGMLRVCKVTFGSEPKDQEVLAFVLEHYRELKFSLPLEASEARTVRNPKRLQREIQRELQHPGVGTKSQQALTLQRERLKSVRKKQSRSEKKAEAREQFEAKQEKKRQKHRGR